MEIAGDGARREAADGPVAILSAGPANHEWIVGVAVYFAIRDNVTRKESSCIRCLWNIQSERFRREEGKEQQDIQERHRVSESYNPQEGSLLHL